MSHDPRCAWCHERYSEHDGILGVGCDEFLPHDYRARAHRIVDEIIDGGSTVQSKRLMRAVTSQIEQDKAEPSTVGESASRETR